MPHHTYNRKEILENITPIIENTAMRYGVIPIEIELVKESSKWFLRVYLFSKDHDINLEDCEKVSRGLDNLLDDLIPFKYYLEISSPGVEKKLKSEKEYIVFNGKSIDLKLKKPLNENEEKHFICRIVEDRTKIIAAMSSILLIPISSMQFLHLVSIFSSLVIL